MFERGFYCYKWVKDGEIVYIGKTVTPKLRIAQERKIEKFHEVLDSEIFVTQFVNKTEMDAMEKILINKYQPKLNVVDKNEASMELPVDESKLVWHNFTSLEKDTELERKIMANKAKIKELNETLMKNKDVKTIMGLTNIMLQNSITSQSFDITLNNFTDLKVDMKVLEKFLAENYEYTYKMTNIFDYVSCFVLDEFGSGITLTILYKREDGLYRLSYLFKNNKSDIEAINWFEKFDDAMNCEIESIASEIRDLEIEIKNLQSELEKLKNSTELAIA